MIRSLSGPLLRPALRTWHQDSIKLAVVDVLDGNGTHTLSADSNSDRAFEFNQAIPCSESGRVLAADIQLHNRAELAADLEFDAACLPLANAACPREGLSPGVLADERLTLAALDRWDGQAPEHMLGDFAFASWDARHRRLFCARDVVGVRPFYYLHRPGKLFAFASLPKALVGRGLASSRLNLPFFLRRFVSSQENPDESMLSEVCRLPAGHALAVSAGSFHVRRYWNLPDAPAGWASARPADVAAELGHTISQAVQCRLPLSGPVASHLSGGLDSSAVTILAHRMLRAEGRAVLAYSFLARPDDRIRWQDESPFVKAVLDAERDIHWQPLYREPLAQALAPPTDIGQVFSNSDLHPEHQVCISARAAGASLVLSGWGGDQGATFGGRGTLAEAAANGHWLRVAWELVAISYWSRALPHSIFRGEVWSYFQSEREVHSGPGGLGRLRSGKFESLLTESAVALLDFKRIPVSANGWLNRRAMLTGTHLASRMENWAMIGARHGVAFSFPMLDRRVMEFALKIPSALFVRNGWKRRPFRDAMQQVLPPEILWRRHKYTPFPCLALELAEQRQQVLRRVGELRGIESVAELFDLDVLEQRVRSMPAPDKIRRLEASAGSRGSQATNPHVTMIRAFLYASHLQQHYTQTAA